MRLNVRNLITVITIFITLCETKAAGVPNRKLFRLYPISSRDYESLKQLSNHQKSVLQKPAEVTRYRSLSEWYNNLSESGTRSIKQRPLCEVQGYGVVVHRDRNGRQADVNGNGETAPTIVYTMPSPEYSQYSPYPYGPSTVPVGGGYSTPNSAASAVVNCILVLRTSGQTEVTTTTTTTTRKPNTVPPRPNRRPPNFGNFPAKVNRPPLRFGNDEDDYDDFDGNNNNFDQEDDLDDSYEYITT